MTYRVRRLAGGSAAVLDTKVLADRQVVVDQTRKRVRVGDGTTPGGISALNMLDFPSFASLAGVPLNGIADAAAALTARAAAAPAVVLDLGTALVASEKPGTAGIYTFEAPLEIKVGAKLKPGAGIQTLINGHFEAPRLAVFDLSAGGTVRFGEAAVDAVEAAWFGAKSSLSAAPSFVHAAIQMAIEASPHRVRVPAGQLRTNATIEGRAGKYLNGVLRTVSAIVNHTATQDVFRLDGVNTVVPYDLYGGLRDVQLSRAVAGSMSLGGTEATWHLKPAALRLRESTRFEGRRLHLMGSPLGVHLNQTITADIQDVLSSPPQTTAPSDVVIHCFIDSTTVPAGITPNASTKLQGWVCEGDLGPGRSFGLVVKGYISDQKVADFETSQLTNGLYVDGGDAHDDDTDTDPNVIDVRFREMIHDAFRSVANTFINTGRKGVHTLAGGYAVPAGGVSSPVAILAQKCGGLTVTGGYEVNGFPNATAVGFAGIQCQNICLDETVRLHNCFRPVDMSNVKNSAFRPQIHNRADRPLSDNAIVANSVKRVTFAPRVSGDLTTDAAAPAGVRFTNGVSLDAASSDCTVDCSGIDPAVCTNVVKIGTALPKFDWTYGNNNRVTGLSGKLPKFRTVLAASYPLPSMGAWVKVPFDTRPLNDQSCMSADGTFTAPVDGTYEFQGNVFLGAGAGVTSALLTLAISNAVNTSGLVGVSAFTPGVDSVSLSTTIVLQAGQTVDLRVNIAGTSATLNATVCFFAGSLVGPA